MLRACIIQILANLGCCSLVLHCASANSMPPGKAILRFLASEIPHDYWASGVSPYTFSWIYIPHILAQSYGRNCGSLWCIPMPKWVIYLVIVTFHWSLGLDAQSLDIPQQNSHLSPMELWDDLNGMEELGGYNSIQ